MKRVPKAENSYEKKDQTEGDTKEETRVLTSRMLALT